VGPEGDKRPPARCEALKRERQCPCFHEQSLRADIWVFIASESTVSYTWLAVAPACSTLSKRQIIPILPPEW